jgi:hypothetical protein
LQSLLSATKSTKAMKYEFQSRSERDQQVVESLSQ